MWGGLSSGSRPTQHATTRARTCPSGPVYPVLLLSQLPLALKQPLRSCTLEAARHCATAFVHAVNCTSDGATAVGSCALTPCSLLLSLLSLLPLGLQRHGNLGLVPRIPDGLATRSLMYAFPLLLPLLPLDPRPVRPAAPAPHRRGTAPARAATAGGRTGDSTQGGAGLRTQGLHNVVRDMAITNGRERL